MTIESELEENFHRLTLMSEIDPKMYIWVKTKNIRHRQEVFDRLQKLCKLMGIDVDIDNVRYTTGVKPYKMRIRPKE